MSAQNSEYRVAGAILELTCVVTIAILGSTRNHKQLTAEVPMHIYLIAILPLCFAHAPVMAESDNPDLKRLQGVWRNATGGDDESSRVTVTIDENRVDFRGPRGEWYTGTFEINSDSKPKTICVTFADGWVDEIKGKASNGIYRFDGKKLTLAGRRPGDDAEPKGFDDPKCRTVELVK